MTTTRCQGHSAVLHALDKRAGKALIKHIPGILRAELPPHAADSQAAAAVGAAHAAWTGESAIAEGGGAAVVAVAEAPAAHDACNCQNESCDAQQT